MGGWGSGRWQRNGKSTAEGALPLDIRKLKQAKVLTPGRTFSWQWSTGGNVHASIGAVAYQDHLMLRYSHRGESVEQKVSYTWTSCNYGGERIWFSCPFCGRRCAVIYGAGKYFACRSCYPLVYKTCNESKRDRLFSKANKLRKKIGAMPGCLNPLPIFKPKGMHEKTWQKIRCQIQAIEYQGLIDLGRMIGVNSD